MNPKKTFTAVLVTGATVAGVAGVLVLNPTTSSLITAPTAAETGTAGGSGSIGGSGSGSGTGLLQGLAAAREDDDHDNDHDRNEHGDDHDDDHGDDSDHGGQALGSGTTGAGTTAGASTATGTTGSTGTAGSGATTSGNTTTGAAYQSPYGPMQVSITVSGNQVTGIQWVQLPGDGKSNRINNYAAPLLVEQGLQAQSATVDGVSGATYTTEGFRTSLASAISKAGL